MMKNPLPQCPVQRISVLSVVSQGVLRVVSPECFSGQNQAAGSPFSDFFFPSKKGKREDLELGGCSSEYERRVSFPFSFVGGDKHQHSAGQG